MRRVGEKRSCSASEGSAEQFRLPSVKRRRLESPQPTRPTAIGGLVSFCSHVWGAVVSVPGKIWGWFQTPQNNPSPPPLPSSSSQPSPPSSSPSSSSPPPDATDSSTILYTSAPTPPPSLPTAPPSTLTPPPVMPQDNLKPRGVRHSHPPPVVTPHFPIHPLPPSSSASSSPTFLSQSKSASVPRHRPAAKALSRHSDRKTQWSQSSSGPPNVSKIPCRENQPSVLRQMKEADEAAIYREMVSQVHDWEPSSPALPPLPSHRRPESIGPVSPEERHISLPSSTPSLPSITTSHRHTSTTSPTPRALRSSLFTPSHRPFSTRYSTPFHPPTTLPPSSSHIKRDAQTQTQQSPATSPVVYESSHLREVKRNQEWMRGLRRSFDASAAHTRKYAEELIATIQEDHDKRMEAEADQWCTVVKDMGLMVIEEMSLEMTDEQRQKVAMATGYGRTDEVLSDKFNIRITRNDLHTLTGLEWLNDEIINFYFNMIAERSQGTVHCMSSFFYPKYTTAGYSGVRRWTRKVDIFNENMQAVLFPIHLGMHWCLAVINFKDHRLEYYDSLKGQNSNCLKRLREYLKAESLDKKKIAYDVSDWEDYYPYGVLPMFPEQLNGSDCGVFTCMYARFVAKGLDFTFHQEQMPEIRSHMIVEILEKRLF